MGGAIMGTRVLTSQAAAQSGEMQLKERYAHLASRQLPVEPDLQIGKEVSMNQAFLVQEPAQSNFLLPLF
jgi:hypothetical protein